MGAVRVRSVRVRVRSVRRSGGSRGRVRRPLRVVVTFTLVSALCGALMTSFLLPVVASAGWAVNSGVDYFDSLPRDLAEEDE